MQVTKEQIGPCTVALDVQVDSETVARAFDRAYRDYSAVTNVPGFRPGKAPRKILERYVDPERVRDRVRERVATKAYQDALRQEQITPYGEPEVEFSDLAEGEPWQFKAVVPLPPKVQLGDLSAVSVERPVFAVSDADVDEEVESIRRDRGRLQQVTDRGLQAGDTAVVEMRITLEGEEPAEGDWPRSLVRMGNNIPGFDEAVEGQRVGEERTFELTFPEDYDDAARAGKRARFDVRVSSIAAPVLPDVTDEWVRSVSSYQSVEELRNALRERREQMVRDLSERVAESRVLEQLVASSQIEYPEALVDEEVEEELQSLGKDLERRGISYEAYLEQTGQTQEQHRATLREAAEGRVKSRLVFQELARLHGVRISDEEVDAEFASMVDGSAESDAQLRRLSRDPERRTQMVNSILRQKLRQILFAGATVTDAAAPQAG